MVEESGLTDNGDAGRRAGLEKLAEYSEIASVFSYLVADEAGAERMKRALWGVCNHGYGRGADFFDCLSSAIPYVFRICSHLVASLDDFEALAKRMPEILKSLPCESSGYLDGTDYTFDTLQLQELARQAVTIADFFDNSPKNRSGSPACPVDNASQPSVAAWTSEFPEDTAELESLGAYLIDSAGNDFAGKVVKRCASSLSAVIYSRQDLQNIVAVLRDACAWHKMTGQKWPARVLMQAVAAMSDPVQALKKHLPAGSVLAAALCESPSLLLRFLALPDSGLIRNVRAMLPVVCPLINGSRAAAAFVDLLVLMTFNLNIDYHSFFTALPAIATSAGPHDSAMVFSLARELLLTNHLLYNVNEWLPSFCEVVRAVPAGEPARLHDITRLFSCGELVGHCVPLLEHGVLWPEIRDNLLQMWKRLRKNFAPDSEARLQVAGIFAREIPQITNVADFVAFCGMFPDALSPLSKPRGRFFMPRFQSDMPEAMPGSDLIPPDMSVRLLSPYPQEVENHGFRHVAVWWNGRSGAFEYNELASVMSGNLRAGSYNLSGQDAWALLGLAREKFPPEANDASLQLTARTLGTTLVKLRDLLEKSRSYVFPEKGQYDDR